MVKPVIPFHKALWPGINTYYGKAYADFDKKVSYKRTSRCCYCGTRTTDTFSNCRNCGASNYESLAS